MKHRIENEFLSVEINEMGAELSSIFGKTESFEYLWQGDPNIWTGRSPILFPIAGRLLDDKYTLEGSEYSLPKHGFARKRHFELLQSSENEIIFIQKEDKETLESYPYKFDLIIKYTLDGKKLTAEHRIVNKNSYLMYFSVGAHPGFNCEIGDFLEFQQNETLDTEKVDLYSGLRNGKRERILTNSKIIEITADIFNDDALLLYGVKSKYITLKSPRNSRAVKFSPGGAPYLGIWAKPGAPYVCLEPWFGINDSYEKKDDLSQKDGILSIPSGDSFAFAWTAEMQDRN